MKHTRLKKYIALGSQSKLKNCIITKVLKIKVKCLEGPIVLISSFEKSISEPLNQYNLPDLINFLVIGSLYFMPKLKKTFLFDEASELSVYDELDALF